MLHYALGDRLVRALTLASRPFFDDPPDAFSDVPLGRPMPVLVYAREDEREALDALDAEICAVRDARAARRAAGPRAVPVAATTTRVTGSPTATASGSTRMRCFKAICASCARSGGELVTGAARRGDRTRRAALGKSAPSAASHFRRRSWSTPPAPGPTRSRGSPASRPLGLEPKRRTIITFDAPAGHRRSTACRSPRPSATSSISRRRAGGCSPRRWTRCRASRCDAQPDEYEVALAA